MEKALCIDLHDSQYWKRGVESNYQLCKHKYFVQVKIEEGWAAI